jgi:hypothetical protein
MANPENEIPADDANAEKQAEATEVLRDLEPMQDVKGGRPRQM